MVVACPVVVVSGVGWGRVVVNPGGRGGRGGRVGGGGRGVNLFVHFLRKNDLCNIYVEEYRFSNMIFR